MTWIVQVFKDGRPTTLRKAETHNARVVKAGWVHACQQANEHLDEQAYTVDSNQTPKDGKVCQR
jgi:hypothetical protein